MRYIAGTLLSCLMLGTGISALQAAQHHTTAQPGAALQLSINNVTLHGVKAILEHGIVTLYTGKDPDFHYGTRLVIFFLLDKAAGQKIDIDTNKQFSSISIHINSKEHMELNGIVDAPVQVNLESGTEKDYRVPVHIHLRAGKKLRVQIDGNFALATSRLVARNGVIDRSVDNLDTIEYIAREYVKSRYPGKTVHFDSAQLNWYSNGPQPRADGKGKLQVAGYSARFRVDDNPLQINKLQLAKRHKTWQVIGVLPPQQMVAAHPLVDRSYYKIHYRLQLMAARHFEKHFYNTEGGWRKIKEPVTLLCGGARLPGQKGYCELDYGRYYKASFKLNGSYEQVKCTARTYVFTRKSGKWIIDQILPANKKFDPRQDKVVERKRPIWGC